MSWGVVAISCAYLLILSASYWVAFELRFDFQVTERYLMVRAETFWWVLLLKFSLLLLFGQIDCVLSYFRMPDAIRILQALFIATLVLIVLWYQYGGGKVPPRSVILSDFQFSFLALCGLRFFLRVISSKSTSGWSTPRNIERVIIVGAGEVGAGLCAELQSKGHLGMRAVAFLDDDVSKIGRYIHGVRVASAVDRVAEKAIDYNVKKVVIAFPSASTKRVREVAKNARNAGLKVDIVPALTDLVSGRAELSSLRPVELEDFLQRDAINLDSHAIAELLRGKRVLITGAGGSIGTELVKQVIGNGARNLLCVDQAEIAIFNLQQMLQRESIDFTEVQTKVIDICDEASVDRVMKVFQPEIIFHAAAHKHVNLMESQPDEALKNNTLGTLGLARLAALHGVEHFILISTDKAINPTSIMGVSKRLAELSILSQQKAEGNKTRFIAVRFGNVLGSSGSVIPVFRQQIAEGGPVTVTDEEVTRFFMTVKESVGLVLQSATEGNGGEIFVLDMGESVKIIDVAKQMIELSGMRLDVDIKIDIIGLRAGEKRYEEVQHLSEKLHATKHPRVLRFIGNGSAAQMSASMEERIRLAIDAGDKRAIISLIQEIVPEYQKAT
jgi:FlaA1/EpsC-like NDP-sugar epimerase